MTRGGLSRRAALGMVAGGMLSLAGSPASARDASPPRRGFRYAVFVDGAASGGSMVHVLPRPDGFSVVSLTRIEVETTLWGTYRFSQKCREDWNGGQLSRMDCLTDDDGTISRVEARRDGNGYAVAGSRGRRVVPDEGIPPGFWTGSVLGRRSVIEPETGDLVAFATQMLIRPSTKIAGTVVRGRGYRFESFISGEIWFDAAQHLAAMTFWKSGSEIALVRVRDAGGMP